jgi:hypothetical protein
LQGNEQKLKISYYCIRKLFFVKKQQATGNGTGSLFFMLIRIFGFCASASAACEQGQTYTADYFFASVLAILFLGGERIVVQQTTWGVKRPHEKCAISSADGEATNSELQTLCAFSFSTFHLHTNHLQLYATIFVDGGHAA